MTKDVQNESNDIAPTALNLKLVLLLRHDENCKWLQNVIFQFKQLSK